MPSPGHRPEPLILALPGNEAFARNLANAGAWELGTIETRSFPDGESYVRILSDVAERSVALVARWRAPTRGSCVWSTLRCGARSGPPTSR